MKNVLLLGDSIRMFYSETVKKKLGTAYRVFWPDENGRFALYTLNSLRHWLPELPKPDIIHWNNGLWDTNIIYQEDGTFTSLDTYIDALKKILRELRKTGAQIIFATTTPCNPRKESHDNEEIARFNAAAVALMTQEGIAVNDLYAVVSPHIDTYICEDQIHSSEAGTEALGTAVAKAIQAAAKQLDKADDNA